MLCPNPPALAGGRLSVFKNGAQSWLNSGIGTFQPSEFIKIFLMLALAKIRERILN
ncbi:FtsW/RodA/SpoVE family cell cycle protein [Alkalihalobacillus deserti]|uniref:FtsW/RodA/SpoVE family cell cycle protein n=1 Tax=Alkalihalobacillus deserti TaxID=2879466 RepID=UPI001D151F46|nr:FtsW/RodA/SpoVE family cell cycle protein [Alkalihalobacillus deserti]